MLKFFNTFRKNAEVVKLHQACILFEKSHNIILFDRDFYCLNYPDVPSSEQNTFKHYILYGWKEGRNPSAFFNTENYLAANEDVRAQGINPLVHYIANGFQEGRKIEPDKLNDEARLVAQAFDSDFYRETYPDVEKSGANPLQHFLDVGWREGRDPSSEFNTSFYLSAYKDVRESDVNPLFHYLTEGKEKGFFPTPIALLRAKETSTESVLPKARTKARNRPLISIVIPSYFHEAYIEAAVDSVLNQSWGNLELIVIDDGSKDRSLHRLHQYRDERMLVIPQKNAGAHAAINRGLGMCRGEYLTILNSDDTFDSDRLMIMADEMAAQAADFGCSWIQQMDHEGTLGVIKKGWENQMPGWSHGLERLDVPPERRFLYELLRTNFISTTSNLIFTKRLYDDIGGMRNLRFAHDWDFALRAALKYKGILLPVPLMQYRTHGTNTISSNPGWMLFEVCWILATHIENIAQALDIAPDRLERSHYGSTQPVYGALRDYLAAAGPQNFEQAAEALLDNEDLRKPYIQQIVI